VVHWFCDTFFDDTPGIGPALIGPFGEHHRDPLAMTRRGFLEVNRSNDVVMVPVLALALWRGGPAAGASAPFGQALLLFCAVAVALTNQFHKSVHTPRVPRLVAWLHPARLAVGPAHHARDHASGGRRAFRVITGRWDLVLDRLRVFDGLARLVGVGDRGPVRLIAISPVEREGAVAIVEGWRCCGTPPSPLGH